MTEKQENEINKQIELLGLSSHVVLHGRIPNSEVHQHMKSSEAFLFTSLSEGTPHVILEAIKNNLPIICFDICGHGEVVDESIGIKIPLSNPEESSTRFAKAIEELSRNSELRKTLSDNCLKKQCQCSWENKTQSVLDIYYNLTDCNISHIVS